MKPLINVDSSIGLIRNITLIEFFFGNRNSPSWRVFYASFHRIWPRFNRDKWWGMKIKYNTAWFFFPREKPRNKAKKQNFCIQTTPYFCCSVKIGTLLWCRKLLFLHDWSPPGATQLPLITNSFAKHNFWIENRFLESTKISLFINYVSFINSLILFSIWCTS